VAQQIRWGIEVDMRHVGEMLDPTGFAVFLLCILAIGFMIRFLGALVAEQRKYRTRVSLPLKPLQGREKILVLSTHPPQSAQHLRPLRSSNAIESRNDWSPSTPVATLEISGKW
jgi:hypothetical protein